MLAHPGKAQEVKDPNKAKKKKDQGSLPTVHSPRKENGKA